MMQLHCLVLFALCYGALAMPRPENNGGVSSTDEDPPEEYLKKFYTSNAKQENSEKLGRMQRFLKMKVTGKLDKNTMTIMKTPICGVPDVAEFTTFQDRPKWVKTNLTYSILNYTQDLPPNVTDDSIQRALNVWSQVTPLNFTRVNKEDADILIMFVTRAHGDLYPFNGKGDRLAHGFAPGSGIGGDVHFDDDENWTNDLTGVNLFLVATHEFGHSLGLHHSTDTRAVMFPNDRYVEPNNFHLSEDDIKGIQSLYGAKPKDGARPKDGTRPK